MTRGLRFLLLSLVLLGAAGCRLSDPIYAMKPLHASEPPRPEYSLLLVTVKNDTGWLFTRSIDTIYFQRVDPGGRWTQFYTTESYIFRVFGDRMAKDGHFLVRLPPGVYELTRMDQGRTHYLLQENARVSSRIHITEPGLYDLGTLWIRTGPKLEAAGDALSPERQKLLQDAIHGTQWERLLDKEP
jgi:hypothetical protein